MLHALYLKKLNIVCFSILIFTKYFEHGKTISKAYQLYKECHPWNIIHKLVPKRQLVKKKKYSECNASWFFQISPTILSKMFRLSHLHLHRHLEWNSWMVIGSVESFPILFIHTLSTLLRDTSSSNNKVKVNCEENNAGLVSFQNCFQKLPRTICSCRKTKDRVISKYSYS